MIARDTEWPSYQHLQINYIPEKKNFRLSMGESLDNPSIVLEMKAAQFSKVVKYTNKVWSSYKKYESSTGEDM